MTIRRVLATNLRSLRQQRGLSQEELAHLASIDRGYIGSIEREKYAVSIDKLDQIAKALKVEASDLLKRPTCKP